MADFGVHAAKPCLPKSFAAALIHEGSVGALNEIFGSEFSSIHETDGNTIGEQRTKFLHQVQRQRGPAITRLVHEAKKRIQAYRMANAGEFLGQHGITHRDERVNRVAGRTAVSAAPIEIPILSLFEHG